MTARRTRWPRRRRRAQSPAETNADQLGRTWSLSWLRPPSGARRLVNRFADAQIGAAPADIAAHRRIDVGIGRRGVAGEERRGGHQLTRLAVAALRHVELEPGPLQRVRGIGGEAFGGGGPQGANRDRKSL